MASIETEVPFLIQSSSSDNQARYAPDPDWDQFLMKNMAYVSDCCTQARPYEKIYREIASQRQQFALQKEVKYANRFGTIRADLSRDQLAWNFPPQDLTQIYELVNTDPESCWHKQAPAIIDAVSAEISPFSFFSQPRYGTYTVYCPLEEESTSSLSTIRLSRDNLPNTYYVEITYPAPVKEWQASSRMFIAMMTAKSIPEFLRHTAGFLYYESHFLRCLRGSESILQIIVGGVAHFKGIELKFNSNLEIGWNFKALITKDKERYQKWFVEHVFSTKKQIRKPREMLAELPVEGPKDEKFLKLKLQIAADFQHEGLFGLGFFGADFGYLPTSVQELIDANTFKHFCLIAIKHSQQKNSCSEKTALLFQHIFAYISISDPVFPHCPNGLFLGSASGLHNELFMAGILTRNNNDVPLPERKQSEHPLPKEDPPCLVM